MVIGIDFSSETHYARAFDWRGLELSKVFKFESTSYGFENFSEWLTEICKTNQKDNIIIGAEPTGHYWFTLAEYLKEHDIKFVFVNPMHVKRTKELDDNHPSKNDREDPKVIAKLVIEGRYLIPYIPEDIYAELRIMNENRMRINRDSLNKSKIRTHYQPVQGSDLYCLVRVFLQNLTKNAVKSRVSDSR